MSIDEFNSNTTNVKVKQLIPLMPQHQLQDSNTTNVKVKQEDKPLKENDHCYSNTTNVKVKLPDPKSGGALVIKFKYNQC